LDLIREKNYMDLMMLPRIVDLLHQKWTRYARTGFYTRFIQTLIYVIIFTCAVVLRSPNPDYRYYDWSSSADQAQIVFEILLILGWFYKGFREVREFFSGFTHYTDFKGGFMNYYDHTGYVFLENAISTIFIILGFLCFCFRVGNAETAYDATVCLLLIVCWGYMVNLLLGFQLTGPIIIMIYKIYSRDVVRFLSVYICLLIGSSAAFYVLSTTDALVDEGFDVFQDRLKLTFLVMLNIWDFDSFLDVILPEYRFLATILLLLHILTITLMLLNLLIAMMGDTFGQTKDDADKVWHMSYADIIVSLESEMTRKEWDDPKKRYWMDIDGRRWLQIEEVNDTQYLKKDKGRKDVEDIMSQYDVNQDGVVTFEELQAALKKQDEKQAERDYEHNVLSKPVEVEALGTGGKTTSAIYGRAQQQGGDSSVDADDTAKIVTQEF